MAAAPASNRTQRLALVRIAARRGVGADELNRLYAEARSGSGSAASTDVTDPYAVLGVARSASREEVTRAYRRIVSRHHPDRLQAQGRSPEEVRAGAARTDEPRKAHDRICRAKGF